VVSRSSWELDDRPAMGCLVCGAAPTGYIDRVQLSDVHRSFASSAICAVCSSAGRDGDAARLQRRAQLGRPDEPDDVVLDVVRLVLVASGHTVAPRAEPPPEHKNPTPEPLSAGDAALWSRLERLVHDGPEDDVVVRGDIEYLAGAERSVTRVLLDGDRARLGDDRGEPWLITDGTTMWRRGESGMVAGGFRPGAWAGQGSELAHHRSREDVHVFGFGEPIGPIEAVEYLGRPAWRFAFAAPKHKPYDMQVVIDAGTGLILEQRFGPVSVARWTTFTAGGPVDPAMFRWDGPVTTAAELRAARQRESEADLARRRVWFAEQVSDQPLFGDQPVEVTLHGWKDDGSFEASFGGGGVDGTLARRPRSSDWWNLGWAEVTHRWSDERWDWALSVWDQDGEVDRRFDHAAFVALIRALHSTPPAL
jgi:hypothetical protein